MNKFQEICHEVTLQTVLDFVANESNLHVLDFTEHWWEYYDQLSMWLLIRGDLESSDHDSTTETSSRELAIMAHDYKVHNRNGTVYLLGQWLTEQIDAVWAQQLPQDRHEALQKLFDLRKECPFIVQSHDTNQQVISEQQLSSGSVTIVPAAGDDDEKIDTTFRDTKDSTSDPSESFSSDSMAETPAQPDTVAATVVTMRWLRNRVVATTLDDTTRAAMNTEYNRCVVSSDEEHESASETSWNSGKEAVSMTVGGDAFTKGSNSMATENKTAKKNKNNKRRCIEDCRVTGESDCIVPIPTTSLNTSSKSSPTFHHRRTRHREYNSEERQPPAQLSVPPEEMKDDLS